MQQVSECNQWSKQLQKYTENTITWEMQYEPMTSVCFAYGCVFHDKMSEYRIS